MVFSIRLSISVSIIEDDDDVRKILTGWLSRAKNFRCLSEHSNCEEAMRQLQKNPPDVVLMDINLPGMNGIQCVGRLKPVMPSTQYLMLTVYEDSEHIFEALAAGASGYLLKRTPREELLASIKQVHEGGAPMTSYIARKVVQAFHRPKSNKPDVAVSELSPREWEVLGLLARGFAYKEIADQLGISLPTVNTHIHRTYEKLHVRSRGEAVACFSQFPALPPGNSSRRQR
jgi:DNA-binding NarL/FixJ family response regulator